MYFCWKGGFLKHFWCKGYIIFPCWCTIFMVTAGWDEGDEERTTEISLFMYLFFFSVDLTISNHCEIYIMNWPYFCSCKFIFTSKFLAILLNLVFLIIHTQFCILLLIQKVLYNNFESMLAPNVSPKVNKTVKSIYYT